MRFLKPIKPVSTLHTEYIIIKLNIILDCCTYSIFSSEENYVPLSGFSLVLNVTANIYPVTVMHEIIEYYIYKTHIAEATAPVSFRR